MKLHLPASLRKLLLAACAICSALQSGSASMLFDAVNMATYTDFAQNCGRYQAGRVNDLLTYIRQQDGGIVITYQGDLFQNESYTIPLQQGMIDFASASGASVDTCINLGFLATVDHNGIQNPQYASSEVGGNYAVRYNGIEYRRSEEFHLRSGTDYKIARLNKLVTDVQPSEMFYSNNPEFNGLKEGFIYRAGSGTMSLCHLNANGTVESERSLNAVYAYSTGGMVSLEWIQRGQTETDDNFSIYHTTNSNLYTEITGKDLNGNQVGKPNPLPYVVRGGDSGSPSWVWNPETESYQYLCSGQSGAQWFTQDRGSWRWTYDTMDSFNVYVDLGTGNRTIELNAVNAAGTPITGTGDGVEVTTTPYSGTMVFTDAKGHRQTKSFIGVRNGTETWHALNPIKDEQNWFNYGTEYFNADRYVGENKALSYADLIKTNSLVLQAADSETYTMQLNDNVDLGIGFVQFSKKVGVDNAKFHLQSAGGASYTLSSAGFAVDKGVTLELDLTNDVNYMREWRKVGEGDLHIVGNGNTNALLNVGGSGKVYLERKDGYAAYNVLASSGSTLVIDNLKQVYRDVTLGAGGATLDLNGNDFTWDNGKSPSSAGFTSLHLLSEKDIITNAATGTTATITIMDAGETFIGAFEDTEDAALKVVYNSNSEKAWAMNTVFTNLRHNAQSSFTVESGEVTLSGVRTVHGRGSTGLNTDRLVVDLDWHYADAEMNVDVKDGAYFTLGSHARLTGTVTVQDGGTFLMREGVTQQMEYLEGGLTMQDTYKYREYYGLHGNIVLNGSDATLQVKFNQSDRYDTTTSENVYTGNISGNGNVYIDTAGGSLILEGKHTFSGTKVLESGMLIAKTSAALGDTETLGNKWNICESGVLIVHETEPIDIGTYIDESSKGVYALSESTSTKIDISRHHDLIIGAEQGKVIEYGAKNTEEELTTNDAEQWILGGGGGNLTVNFRLNKKDGTLVLGNEYTTGTVTLTNEGNSIGSIDLVGGVTLAYTSNNALGNASVQLNYGNRIVGSQDTIKLITTDSSGVILVDNMAKMTIDLSERPLVCLAADKDTLFTGEIILGDDTYRFGGGGGVLTLDKALTDSKDEGGNVERRNLLIDGEFYRPNWDRVEDTDNFAAFGTTIALNQALELTGSVTIQGYDFSRAIESFLVDDEFDIFNCMSYAVLRLNKDNAFNSVSCVEFKDCSFLDINGTTQTFRSMRALANLDETFFSLSSIVDTSAKQGGTVILDVWKGEEGQWDMYSNVAGFGIDVSQVTKTGNGTLELNIAMQSDVFTIEEGTVVLLDTYSLNDDGVTVVEKTGVLNVSQLDIPLQNKTIELKDGGQMATANNEIGGTVIASSSTGTITNNSGITLLSGTIGAEAGATLALCGNFRLSGSDHNGNGGTISDAANSKLSLAASETAIGGTLRMESGSTLCSEGLLKKEQEAISPAHHSIAELNVAEGASVQLTETSGSTIWDIGKLGGKGSMTWVPAGTHETTSRMTLNGASEMTGTLTVQPSASMGNRYQAHLVLAHGDAANGLTVNLQGANDSHEAAMAINAENVRMEGLKGTEHSIVYAGNAMTDSSQTPVSTAKSTLTTVGSGTYTYQGAIAAGENGAGISLSMEGSGKQIYNGSVVVQDVMVRSGTLQLDGNRISIAGNVQVEQGAVLEMSHELTLSAGQSLIGGSGGKAGLSQVLGKVNFNGGSLTLDASSLNNMQAALSINAVSMTGNLDILFANSGSLKAGVDYLLTTGTGWTGKGYTAVGVDYLDATFNATSQELRISFTEKAGNSVWDGMEEHSVWSAEIFGTGEKKAGESTRVVFNDSASSKDVQVHGEVKSASLTFDNRDKYTLDTTSGSVTTEDISLIGTGTVALGKEVVAHGTVSLNEGSHLVLLDGNALSKATQITGGGILAFCTGDQITIAGVNIQGVGGIEVQSGTLQTDHTLQTRELHVAAEGKLVSTTANILNGATVYSAGTVEISISSGSEVLGNSLTMENGAKGTLLKSGSGTLVANRHIEASKVVVADGSLKVTDRDIIPGFLSHVDHLEVRKGASAYIGRDACNISLDYYTTSMTVDGGTLELASAQRNTDTIRGNLEVINGGKFSKVDGGLRITGDALLGANENDCVTLYGNWGKGGTIFEGVVSGDGLVQLTHGPHGEETFTFSGQNNTFKGTYEVMGGVRLLATSEKAVATANINLNGGSLVLGAETIKVNNLTGKGVVDFSSTEALGTAKLVLMEGNGHYQGSIGTGFSIVKDGAGMQMFSGSAQGFSGSVAVNAGTLSIGAGAMDMLNGASSTTLAQGATLQLDGAAELLGDATLDGTLAIGGTIATRANLSVGEHTHIILGGNSYQQDGNVHIYTVFAEAVDGKVSGWENLNADDFGGFGSVARGVTITKGENYTVRVDTTKVNNLDITWSENVADGTWDLHSANFAESGERTAYFEGDTVTIASNADITMGQAVHLQGSAGTLNVQNGAHASIAQTADNTLKMDVLHVKGNSEFTINSVADNFANKAIVDEGSTLNVRFGSTLADSGAVKEVTGGGTLHLVNTNGSGLYDLGDRPLSGETEKIDLSAFTGTLELGNGSTQIRLRDDRVGVLNRDATVEVNAGAQFWKTRNGGNNTTLNNDIVLRGNSGAASSNSKDGFGAVRGATEFNGEVTIDGNAMVSGAGIITFNGNIKGSGENDTLTFGCYYGGQGSQTYTLTEGMQAENLANMVVRQSGSNGTTTVNVNSANGLADNLKFADGVGSTKAIVNVNASNNIQRLESTAGNGVVNIAEGKSLALAEGADYGGQLKLAEDVTFTANDKTATAQVNGFVKFESAEADHASITGADGTRIENTLIDLAAGTRLEMANVILASSSSITDASATLVASGLVVEADKTNLAVGEIYNSVAGALKPLTYGATATQQEAPAGQIASLTLSNIQDVAIEGTGLVVSLADNCSRMLGGADWLRLSLGNEGKFTEGLDVTLLYEDATGQQRSAQGVYTWEDVEAQAEAAAMNHGFVYFRLTGAVPEPATSTLSLLALAALAARRRRK